MTSSTPVLRKYFDFILFDNFNSFSNSKGLKRPAQNTPSWMGFQGIPLFFLGHRVLLKFHQLRRGSVTSLFLRIPNKCKRRDIQVESIGVVKYFLMGFGF